MLLIENGNSEYKIVWKKENAAAEFAACELKKYLEKSAGVSLELLSEDSVLKGRYFHIGFSEDFEDENELLKTDLNDDGFVLDITENEVFLNAKNGRGLIFGIYRFLEDFLGIRFINMGCEKIPAVYRLELPVKKIIEKPDFAMRSYLNGKMLTGKGEEYDLYHLKNKMCNEHRHLAEKMGGECLMYGRGGTHNMSRYVPKEKYMETHPEFYAVCERYTTIDLLNGITDDGKLDETMEVSVAKVVIEELKKDIIANPNAIYFQFEQEDSLTFPTYEEGSKKAKILEKYGRSGILVRFCNMLATELQKWADKELNGRKIYIVTFAYGYSKEPPVIKKDNTYSPIDQSVVAVDNLIIRMAFFSNCAYSYFDERQVAIKDMIRGWRAVCSKFMFWGYDTDFTTFLWYFPSLRNIKKNIIGFKDLGVVYLMFESADGGVNEWQAEIKAYIYGKLMWDTSLNVNELYNEYLENYYGPAAEYVKRVMAIMENYSSFVSSIYDNYIVDTFKWTYRHVDLQNEALFNRVLDILDQAETEIVNSRLENGEAFLKRLSAVKVTFLHMKLNKIHHILYQNIERGEVTRFSGLLDIPPMKKQSFYNVEMEYRVVVPVVIPNDVKEKIDALDVYSISDQLDLEIIDEQSEVVNRQKEDVWSEIDTVL